MDMALYRRIIAALEAPEIIRLNYSGESTHHPQIIEAIELAASTGATTELVTALGSLPDRLIAPLAASGLDRLTLSLHTLDPMQYDEIYGYSSIEAVRQKVAALATARNEIGATKPTVDIAMVAMRRNLTQLQPLASFAAEIGATGFAIHPIIRRDPVPDPFSEELEGEKLRPDFLSDLAAAIERVRSHHPDLPISVSTPEIDGDSCLSDRPTPFPGKLPPGALIHSCEQNPWDTVHILADGSVVTCEVRDHTPLGKIAVEEAGPDLATIWKGAVYSAFRGQYRSGDVVECRDCPYKTAFMPQPPVSAIDAAEGTHAQLQYGWHQTDGAGVLWAKRVAALELARPRDARRLHIEGVVPSLVGRVHVQVDGVFVGDLGPSTDEPMWMAADFPLPTGNGAMVSIVVTAEQGLIPVKAGLGMDVRELGFGLKSIGLS
jgi:MoaA/NifB/PqqE/SkfB family radical SAM enzyme